MSTHPATHSLANTFSQARIACDPDLQSPRTFLDVDAERPRPRQGSDGKGLLTLLPTGYLAMGNPDASPVHPKMYTSHPSYTAHHAPQGWPSSEMQVYPHEQFHSAPITAEGTPLQTFQAQPSRTYPLAVPPATAPLTVTTSPHADRYPAYDPRQPMYHHPPPPGPLQIQQAAYASVPFAATGNANSAPPTGAWAPGTTSTTVRPFLPHVHSVLDVHSRLNSPHPATQDALGPGSVEAPRNVLEEQYRGRGVGAYNVYDPALVGGDAGRATSSRVEGDDDPAEGEESDDDDDDNDDDAKDETSMQVVPFDEFRDQRRSRPRLSVVTTHEPTPAPTDPEERGRPRKRSKRGLTTTEQEDVVAVKASGKGNQFILTLYTYVPYSSNKAGFRC